MVLKLGDLAALINAISLVTVHLKGKGRLSKYITELMWGNLAQRLSCKWLWKLLLAFVSKLMQCNFYKWSKSSTVSNAFDRSKVAQHFLLLQFYLFYVVMSFITRVVTKIVLCFSYPDWCGLQIEYKERNGLSWLYIKDSIILARQESFEIGLWLFRSLVSPPLYNGISWAIFQTLETIRVDNVRLNI